MELPPTWSGVLLGMPGGEMKALGLAYMADMMLAGRCYSSLNAYRSWLAAWFRGNGYAPPPTSDHDFLRFMHGAQNKLRKRSRHRSALTWDLIVRLLGVWLTWGVGKNYMLFVVVAYTFALRFGETVQLQWPAIWDLGVTVQLNVPAFKNWKEVTSVVLSRGHILDSAMALMGADWPSDILTSVKQVEMNRLIKKGMEHLGFTGWYTIHSTKHGRCVDLRCRYGLAVKEIGAIVRVRSKATVTLYSNHPEAASRLGSAPAVLPMLA